MRRWQDDWTIVELLRASYDHRLFLWNLNSLTSLNSHVKELFTFSKLSLRLLCCCNCSRLRNFTNSQVEKQPGQQAVKNSFFTIIGTKCAHFPSSFIGMLCKALLLQSFRCNEEGERNAGNNISERVAEKSIFQINDVDATYSGDRTSKIQKHTFKSTTSSRQNNFFL